MGTEPIGHGLAPYVVLMRAFSGHPISAADYSKVFFALYENDPTMWPTSEFDILDRFFAQVDAFEPEERLQGGDAIDEAQLAVEAKRAIEALRALPKDR